MASRKSHISLEGFFTAENFESRRRGRAPVIPLRNREPHGRQLLTQYSRILQTYSERLQPEQPPIADDLGIYVEISSFPDCPLPLNSLDTRDFKLYSCRDTVDGREIALVFIPEARRVAFQSKLDQYLNPQLDRQGQKPRNHNLIGSIEAVRLAELSSFWTDAPERFPADANQEVWWELWLRNRTGENSLEIAQQLSERIGAQLGNTSQQFFDSSVVLIKATTNQLAQARELIGNLEELRRAKETPNVLIHSSPVEQQAWIDDLCGRVQLQPDISTSVCILDSGVNYTHPLLAHAIDGSMAECWHPGWSHFDAYSILGPFDDHGSKQAGLALFGDLQQAVVDSGTVVLAHQIESARIFPPMGSNDPELYGAITIGTAEKIETERPDWNRVYSLAITSDVEDLGGQPSSWSAEIDLYASGFDDGRQRLFIISTGNNSEISPSGNHWDQIHLAQIEDPAQSWNALTVGAYTELTTNDDPDFDGWAPLAKAGDASPATRSAVSWGWRKQAPFKPDIVAEGGNRLLSPDKTEVSNADVVSLLTTSGRSTGQLFETNADTSAATALVSRQAAVLMTEYPDYWPETIRGLLVHSAEWTPVMRERFGVLYGEHSNKTAKETMLRTVGFGVPNLDRARYSANHALTLIAQNQINPFTKGPGARASDDPKLNEMQLYQLPWPIEVLQQLPPELEVKLRITLSYFVEPNPGRRGYRQRYSYQSHGLRFEVIRPGQTLDNFRSFVNGAAVSDDYQGPEGDRDGWLLGPQLRTRGSLHSDTWIGSAAELADMHTIAVFPVGGWWKYRTAQDRWEKQVRYSLLISIDVPDESVDIFSVVETLVETEIEITV
tara:strand:- start:219 stop:2732 length:2514 start_codon:yes stop_codon:yes gene_type:complete